MSPASQGSLEVERYIGSNLISSCARINNAKSNKKGRKPEGKLVLQRTDVNQTSGETHHHRHGGNRHNLQIPSMLPACGCNNNFNFPGRPGQFGAARWTGVPLISVAGDAKKKNQTYQDHSRALAADDDSTLRTPLSRLAIHTQGAPLILTGRCYNGRKNQNKGNQVRSPRGDLVIRRSNKYKDNHSHGHGGPSDCLSVASDESSGSGHSENCLPRIIKPRKRRKKDRKPSIPSAEGFAGEETNGTASEAAKPLCEKTTETEIGEKKNSQKCDIKPNLPVQGLSILNGSQFDEASEDDACGPKLHHTFEDVTESESLSYGCLPSSCQCHYCDPSGIWDAPSNFFPSRGQKTSSPYLTPPPDATKSFHYFSHSDLALRRSWSEPMSDPQGNSSKNAGPALQHVPAHGLPPRSNSFTNGKTSKAKDWADCGQSAKICGEAVKNPLKSNGDECEKMKGEGKVNAGYGRQCLEVSTEIVTSPNGHRDIEIRFYSTSPPS